MAEWIQHTLVFLLVGGCAAIVLYQLVKTLRRQGGGIGSCCSRGCGQEPHAAEKVVFLPREMLVRRKKF